MSGNYAMLTSIELANFMSIEEGRLEFDDSNIISICGFNDSGKSAVTRALQILLYDSYSRDQVKFIKEGASFFKLQINFEDGVSISKTKYDTGTSIWCMSSNGQVIYTNQLKTGVQAVNDVPEPIAQYLGVLYDDCTDSLINVRRNSDKLFLIDTTGGDNYKILNTVLKSDILAKASMAMNADKNKLNAELQVKTNTFNTIVQQYEALDVAPDAEMEKMRQLISAVTNTNAVLTDITGVLEAYNKMQDIKIYDEVPVVDTARFSSIADIVNLYNESNIAIPEALGTVDIDRFKALEAIMSEYSASTLNVQPIAVEVPAERFKELLEIGNALVEYQNCCNTQQNIETEHNNILAELKKLSEQYNYKICSNCGTVVI